MKPSLVATAVTSITKLAGWLWRTGRPQCQQSAPDVRRTVTASPTLGPACDRSSSETPTGGKWRFFSGIASVLRRAFLVVLMVA